MYCDFFNDRSYIKNVVMHWTPGSSKTFLMHIITSYAYSKGLQCGITALQSARDQQICGLVLLRCKEKYESI